MDQEVYANVDLDKSVNLSCATRPAGGHDGQRVLCPGVQRFRAALLFLSLLCLLLVVGLVGLGVHCASRSRDLDSVLRSAADLSSRLQASEDELSSLSSRLQASEDKLSSLSEDREWLNASLWDISRRLDGLQRLYGQEKSCPAGWTLFASSCYFLSTRTGSWTEGMKDCTARGAHLVVMKSDEEQVFLSGFTKKSSWLGVTDVTVEGSWRWIDGTPLTLTNWDLNQPDNGAGDARWGEEDCGHMTAENQKWNDQRCDADLHWICEKAA